MSSCCLFLDSVLVETVFVQFLWLDILLWNLCILIMVLEPGHVHVFWWILKDSEFLWHRYEFLWVMWNLSLCLIIVVNLDMSVFDHTWTWACLCIWRIVLYSMWYGIVELGHVCIWLCLNLRMFVYMKDSSIQYVTWDRWTWAYMKDSWT